MMQVIISSAFESDLGLALGASLAAAIQQYQPRGQTIYHGLGTGDWLEQGITKARLISGKARSCFHRNVKIHVEA